MVFSLSNALLGAVTSLTTTAGRTLRCCNCPARRARTCHFFMKGKVGGLFRHTLPRKRHARRGMLGVHSRFVPCCSRRGTSLDHPCPNVSRLLGALRRRKVVVTITSGGCRTTAQGLVTRCFPRVGFIRMLKRHRNVPTGPSPSVVGRVVAGTKIGRRSVLCMNSSGMSVRATRRTKMATVNIT